jgi:hypothetical protein
VRRPLLPPCPYKPDAPLSRARTNRTRRSPALHEADAHLSRARSRRAPRARRRQTELCYPELSETLTTLILNLSWDEDPNPMSRDGPPNRLMQKLLRELRAIPLLMRLVQLPFARGLRAEWMGSGATPLPLSLPFPLLPPPL